MTAPGFISISTLSVGSTSHPWRLSLLHPLVEKREMTVQVVWSPQSRCNGSLYPSPNAAIVAMNANRRVFRSIPFSDLLPRKRGAAPRKTARTGKAWRLLVVQ